MAGWYSDWGKYVRLDHGYIEELNGYLQTGYAHLDRIYAVIGEYSVTGARIGDSGNTGDSTGPHLHFELYLNGVRVDPAPYLGLA